MLTSGIRLLRDVSVALLVEEHGCHGDRVHVGSGILVRLDEGCDGDHRLGRVVVATAGHNLDGVNGPRSVRVVPRGRYRADPLRVLALGFAPRGGPDVAWVEIDAHEVARRGLDALHWSYLAGPTESEPELTIYGYPACRLQGRSLSGTRFDLLAESLAASRTVCQHRPDDITVRWASDVHPRGLSGCGIWARVEGRPRPVALARAWHGGRGVLYCTPIGAWLQWASTRQTTQNLQQRTLP